VNNVAPTPSRGTSIEPVDEGSPMSFDDAIFIDPGTDTWTAIVTYGDDESFVPVGLLNDTSFEIPDHIYADNRDEDYTVTITVTDDDGGVGSVSSVVIVNNVNPFELSGGTSTGANAGSPMSFNDVTFTDPGDDTWTAIVDYDDGTPDVLDPVDKTFAIEDHIYTDGGEYTVTITVTDDDGGVGSVSSVVTVLNVDPPTVTASSNSTNVLANPTGLSQVATFTFEGSNDAHTATIDWGDGTLPELATVAIDPVNLGNGTVSIISDYVYATVGPNNGEFEVTVTVTNESGLSGSDSLYVHVVYDTDDINDITSPIGNSWNIIFPLYYCNFWEEWVGSLYFISISIENIEFHWNGSIIFVFRIVNWGSNIIYVISIIYNMNI